MTRVIKATCVRGLNVTYVPEVPGNPDTKPHSFTPGRAYNFTEHSRGWLQHTRTDGKCIFIYLDDFTKHFQVKEEEINDRVNGALKGQ